MPELNLDALKNKKRTSEKYRPYDIPTPSSKKEDLALETDSLSVELKSSVKKSELKEREKVVKQEGQKTVKVQSKKKRPSSPTSDSSSELALKEKIKELEKQIIKSSGKDDSIPSLFPEPSELKTFSFKNTEIDNEIIFRVMKTISDWTEHERKLLLFLLERTDFGTIDNVQLGRREIEKIAVHSNYFKEARNELERKGIVLCQTGYIKASKKKGTFYSLRLDNFLC
jgi:hypothetical protein